MRVSDLALTCLTSLAGSATLAAAWANPMPCLGDCYAHDPAVCIRRSDGKVFRFNTDNEIGIWSADSMKGPWVRQSSVVPLGSKIEKPGRYQLWAPDCRFIDNQYIIYYAVSRMGSQDSAVGYAISPNMEPGTWVDHGLLGALDKGPGLQSKPGDDYNAIDPSFIHTNNGNYMQFGSYWKDIWQVRVGPKGQALIDGDMAAARPLAYDPVSNHPLEGSFMYEYTYDNQDWFYLFWSQGKCCQFTPSNLPPAGQEYHIRVCRSTSVEGPFLDMTGKSCLHGGGTPVLKSHDHVYAPGGQGLVYDPKLKKHIIYYHYANTGISYADAQYQFGWNIVNWDAPGRKGWPTI